MQKSMTTLDYRKKLEGDKKSLRFFNSQLDYYGDAILNAAQEIPELLARVKALKKKLPKWKKQYDGLLLSVERHEVHVSRGEELLELAESIEKVQRSIAQIKKTEIQ